MADHQALAVERGRNAEPVTVVVRGDGPVILPALDIGASTGVLEDDATGLPGAALQAKIEPLAELCVGIGANIEAYVVARIRSDDLDRTRVEGTADFDHGGLGRFGPETPGERRDSVHQFLDS
jgi:hypothetical protein